MKVKIISGTYGWISDKDGSVEPVSKGCTCEVSDAEAARLVGLGVASYVESPAEAPSVPPAPLPGGVETQDTHGADPATEAATGSEEGDSADAEVAKLERMQKVDLEQMAADMGLDFSGAKTKHDLAVLIVAASEPEDGEVPPDLGAGDIVQ